MNLFLVVLATVALGALAWLAVAVSGIIFQRPRDISNLFGGKRAASEKSE